MTYLSRALLFWLTGVASMVLVCCADRAHTFGRSLLLLLFMPFVGYMEMDMIVTALLSIATQ